MSATGTVYTSLTGGLASGVLPNITSTTATSVVFGTPSATGTAYPFTLDAMLTTGSTAGALKVLAYTGNASDAVVIKLGSFCTLVP
jgi:hypothetical protein